MGALYQARGIRAFIFDFDGTLARQTLDFAVMKREALAALAEHVAVPPRPELPTMELLALVGRETEAARAGCDAALAAVRRVELQAAATSSLFPFVRPMLAAFKAKGLACAVITRNFAEAVRTVFPDIDEHMLLFTRDDVPEVKPHPAHLCAALAALNVAPEHALMVGDHPMDIAVGKACGTLTAGVATGGHALEGLRGHDPDFLAPDGDALMRELGIL